MRKAYERVMPDGPRSELERIMNMISMSPRPSARPSSRPSPAAARLSRAATRLLAALGEEGAAASPNPTEPGTLVVRAARAGISLGRGTYPDAIGRELERHDLVQPAVRGGSRADLVVSEAGLAHLRRTARSGSDAFADQHRELVAEPAGEGGESVSVNAAESPLAWLRRRRGPDGEPMIDAAAFGAGERLRRDITLGGLLPAVTARWDGAVGRGGAALRDPAGGTDAAIAARQRVRAALAAIGPDQGDLLVDLCGFLKGLELIERERGWSPRSAKVVARIALGALARHYGLSGEATGPDRSRGLRRWAAEA